MSGLVPAIGLEAHAQLRTRSKMFCPCPAAFGAPPNSQVCPVCLGLPGSLPSPNGRAIEMALRLGLAVGAEVARRSIFARKNYFYPDLPKGYQISQFESPLCTGGAVELLGEGALRSVALERIHLEEDTGKSLHADRADDTLLDMNRCGVPLLEIVTAPEIGGPAEARRTLESLKTLLEYLEICDGNMEEGSLRCDANVSLHRAGEPLGTKTEIKNLNSLRSVERALAAEIERQRGILARGERVRQETLLWDEKRQAVRPMRSKEQSHDYRYFPEPDIGPLEIPAEALRRARAALPETPADRARRFREAWRLPAYDAFLLAGSRSLADYFEACARISGEPKAASNLIMTEVLRAMNETGRPVEEIGVSPAALAQLVALLKEGVVSSKLAKEVFERMRVSTDAPRAIVEREGWTQVSDRGELAAAARRVIERHPGPAADVRGGKEKAFQFLVGQVMKETAGKANPALAGELLREELARLAG